MYSVCSAVGRYCIFTMEGIWRFTGTSCAQPHKWIWGHYLSKDFLTQKWPFLHHTVARCSFSSWHSLCMCYATLLQFIVSNYPSANFELLNKLRVIYQGPVAQISENLLYTLFTADVSSYQQLSTTAASYQPNPATVITIATCDHNEQYIIQSQTTDVQYNLW